jgi:dTMP kinase
MKGKFIVLEGIDGSGTTTQAAKLAGYLFKREGTHIFLTKEPTGFEIGREIKRKLKEDKAAGINPFEEKGEEYTRRYVEDRKHHAGLIDSYLKEGIHVVCDRYKYSTFAYQKAQGQDLDKLIEMHNGLVVPDIVLILDLSAEKALERRMGDKTTPELFEKLEFQREVRENYLTLNEGLVGENIIIMDGLRSIEEVHQRIINYVGNFLEE